MSANRLSISIGRARKLATSCHCTGELSEFVAQDGRAVRRPFGAFVSQLDLLIGRHPLRLAGRWRVSKVFIATTIVGLG